MSRAADLYRAIDSTGATIDFALSGLRDLSPEEHQRVLDLPHQPCL